VLRDRLGFNTNRGYSLDLNWRTFSLRRRRIHGPHRAMAMSSRFTTKKRMMAAAAQWTSRRCVPSQSVQSKASVSTVNLGSHAYYIGARGRGPLPMNLGKTLPTRAWREESRTWSPTNSQYLRHVEINQHSPLDLNGPILNFKLKKLRTKLNTISQ
jgi:hypothetical protein